MPEIETARLRLRKFITDDLDDFASICSDPDVMRYIGTGKPVSREEIEAIHLSGYIRFWEKRGMGRFAVIYKENNELIGYCGFRLFSYPGLNLFGNTPEIVYLLKKAFWCKGLALEAAKACLKYGFKQLGFERIVGLTRSENVPAQRVMERIGMRYETDVLCLDLDCVAYSILREEFQPDDSLYLFNDTF
jgi:RimJ/RimL family protein N-acetyltransferase